MSDYNEDKASLKMSFLQDMLEINRADVSLMREAIEEAMTDYIKIRGAQDVQLRST